MGTTGGVPNITAAHPGREADEAGQRVKDSKGKRERAGPVLQDEDCPGPGGQSFQADKAYLALKLLEVSQAWAQHCSKAS